MCPTAESSGVADFSVQKEEIRIPRPRPIDVMRELVRERPGLRRKQYARLGIQRGLGRSGAYAGFKQLEDRQEIVERRGRWYLHGAERFADPAYVQLLLRTSSGAEAAEAVRENTLVELVYLAQSRPIVVNDAVLEFFGKALGEFKAPLVSLVLNVLVAIADEHRVAIAKSDETYEPEEELRALWSGMNGHPGIGQELLMFAWSHPWEATQTLPLLLKFLDFGLTRAKLIDVTLEIAFSNELRLPAFERVEGTVLAVLKSALREDRDLALRVKEALELHSAVPDSDEAERARRLWSGLRRDLNRILA